ncbi:hypothetical protein NEOLEDRAFT_1126522 [Neolentinus lepideus HHB14362 ss-1]|uniref:VHS domain-containing protein n=1 Tax=Neolentinus lepideus HHB14362 ss-1 TaxID=1314782 RepID=A0A165W9I2_9AGAM|nr:hypothetical protein NEOLEDRAFT_1126522 [Neolentinus lepideus HHB14362 ss-1]
MATIGIAKAAYSFLNHEKPHSSVTDWVEILTASTVEDEAFDGIPELVEVINLQPTGPTEASRALRKKLKHGNAHQQYRALVILKALVENGGHKFQTTFADSQLTDAIKNLSSDPSTDSKVKKKLLSVLASWQNQFQGDASMALVANLYNQCRPRTSVRVDPSSVWAHDTESQRASLDYERKKREEKEKKEEAKRKAKEEKEREKQKREEELRRAKMRSKRRTFDFEKEKPEILTTIANASQATSNLVNAITLVNTEHDSLQTNAEVQDRVNKAKEVRKKLVRYIQLVENEELIGTLIETNDRLVAALEMYNRLSRPTVTEDDVSAVQAGLEAAKITDQDQLRNLQSLQRGAVARAAQASGRGKNSTPALDANVHPDLHDLSFGSLGADQQNLPPPLRPSAPRRSDSDEDISYRRGSLSDFSDYESSDEETHNRQASAAGPSTSHAHRDPYFDSNVDGRGEAKSSPLHDDDSEDPFADPFKDPDQDLLGVGTPGIAEKREMHW